MSFSLSLSAKGPDVRSHRGNGPERHPSVVCPSSGSGAMITVVVCSTFVSCSPGVCLAQVIRAARRRSTAAAYLKSAVGPSSTPDWGTDPVRSDPKRSARAGCRRTTVIPGHVDTVQGKCEEVSMPVYLFFCRHCGKEFSHVLTLAEYERLEPLVCPYCGATEVEQQIGTYSVITSKKS